MAEANSTQASVSRLPHEPNSIYNKSDLRVITNRGGIRVFADLGDVREFSKSSSADLAALTAIVASSSEDSPIVEQALEAINDLAFQLQQSVALMCNADAV